MPQIQLTDIQQNWLMHITKASEQKISLSAYAKKNNLKLKSLYSARSLLVDKGVLPPPDKVTSLPVIHHSAPASPTTSVACKVMLANGVHIEFADINISSLFICVAQL